MFTMGDDFTYQVPFLAPWHSS